jgi:hypothetical protein
MGNNVGRFYQGGKLMTELKTEAKLLDKLKKSATHIMTNDEKHKQKVSFILGSVDEKSGVTRERVEEVLAGQ